MGMCVVMYLFMVVFVDVLIDLVFVIEVFIV